MIVPMLYNIWNRQTHVYGHPITYNILGIRILDVTLTYEKTIHNPGNIHVCKYQ